MKLKVLKTVPVWQSDDGSRKKYNVLTEDGQIYSTWSKVIGQAEKGAEFDVVVEERADFSGRNEKFIKQAATFASRTSTAFDFRDRASIERQVALKCAVEFAVSREQMKSADIIQLAEAFDTFLKHGRSSSDH